MTYTADTVGTRMTIVLVLALTLFTKILVPHEFLHPESWIKMASKFCLNGDMYWNPRQGQKDWLIQNIVSLKMGAEVESFPPGK